MTELAKTHILFPKPLLQRIDKVAGVGRRSQFVIEAAMDKLARVQFSRVLKQAAGTWSADKHPSLKNQSGVNRLLKKLRHHTKTRLRHSHDD